MANKGFRKTRILAKYSYTKTKLWNKIITKETKEDDNKKVVFSSTWYYDYG